MIYFGKRFGWFNGSKTNIFARIFRVPHPLTPDPNVPPLRRMPCRSSLGALLPLDFTSDPPKDALPPLCIISLPSLLRVPSRTTLRYAPPFSRTERYAAHVLPLGLTVAFQFTSRALQGTFLPLHSTCRASQGALLTPCCIYTPPLTQGSGCSVVVNVRPLAELISDCAFHPSPRSSIMLPSPERPCRPICRRTQDVLLPPPTSRAS